MNCKLVIFLQLILALTATHSEPCSDYGFVREVKRRREKVGQVCDRTSEGLAWLHICKEGWGQDDADVWCRQLGYIGAENKGISLKKKDSDGDSLKLSNLMCDPATHLKLVDCPREKVTKKCECVANIRCRRCERDMQCNGRGSCDLRTGTCKCISACTREQPCDIGPCECTGGPDVSCQACQLACQNGGVCDANATCQCPSMYNGTTCQKKKCQQFCQNNGTCLSDGTCDCTGLYYGNSCEKKSCVPTCPPDTECNTNGECENTKQSVRASVLWLQLTSLEKLLLGICIVVGISCIMIACAIAVLACAVNHRKMQRKSDLAIIDNQYEDMAPVPSSSIEDPKYGYKLKTGAITPYSVVDYSVVDYESISVDGDLPYYSTVRSSRAINESGKYESIYVQNGQYENITQEHYI